MMALALEPATVLLGVNPTARATTLLKEVFGGARP